MEQNLDASCHLTCLHRATSVVYTCMDFNENGPRFKKWNTNAKVHFYSVHGRREFLITRNIRQIATHGCGVIFLFSMTVSEKEMERCGGQSGKYHTVICWICESFGYVLLSIEHQMYTGMKQRSPDEHWDGIIRIVVL